MRISKPRFVTKFTVIAPLLVAPRPPFATAQHGVMRFQTAAPPTVGGVSQSILAIGRSLAALIQSGARRLQWRRLAHKRWRSAG
jgi:hypothetical protein